ncbi:alpha/beta hydrolase [Streptomyces avermitilis]|uniref:alpha/beta hydrolase n=1 Tax=Streptomyces avermitilis TaxID=33903 RepID=UPI0033F3248D
MPPGRPKPPTATPAPGTTPRRTPSWWSAPPTIPPLPIRTRRPLAKELANARLLTHNGYGHTALTNPSSCVKEYESRYFVDGTLPPAGVTCQQDTPPFPAPKPHGGIATGGGGTAGIAS